MRLLLILAALFLTMPAAAQDAPEWTLVIHGGAGTIERDRITPEQDSAIRAALTQALETGSAILDEGGSALDAVEATLRVLEDDPHFNAGRGAVFTWQGTIEHDASIMDGATRDAGAVTGTSNTRHPITLARRVMDSSPHVFLSGEGADQFSREQGLEQAENSWFETDYRRGQWEEFRQRTEGGEELGALDVEFKYGTVGAVAMDREGHMAAATSTGGMTGKRWGRIGDSPVIGAGTYADDRACAVSATGDGEYFIRAGVAHEICIRIRIEVERRSAELGHEYSSGGAATVYRARLDDETVQAIADEVIADQESLGGTGGVIVTTPWGNRIYSFDTPGMYRGMAAEGEEPSVAIYGDE